MDDTKDFILSGLGINSDQIKLVKRIENLDFLEDLKVFKQETLIRLTLEARLKKKFELSQARILIDKEFGTRVYRYAGTNQKRFRFIANASKYDYFQFNEEVGLYVYQGTPVSQEQQIISDMDKSLNSQ